MCISYVKIAVSVSVETAQGASFVANYAADHNLNGTKAGVTESPFETCVTDQ
jgi:hypothetical protein